MFVIHGEELVVAGVVDDGFAPFPVPTQSLCLIVKRFRSSQRVTGKNQLPRRQDIVPPGCHGVESSPFLVAEHIRSRRVPRVEVGDVEVVQVASERLDGNVPQCVEVL